MFSFILNKLLLNIKKKVIGWVIIKLVSKTLFFSSLYLYALFYIINSYLEKEREREREREENKLIAKENQNLPNIQAHVNQPYTTP